MKPLTLVSPHVAKASFPDTFARSARACPACLEARVQATIEDEDGHTLIRRSWEEVNGALAEAMVSWANCELMPVASGVE